ncbi:MAG: family 78 glycoside hydrolase catalytic domain [Caldicoprobacterales bacterium]
MDKIKNGNKGKGNLIIPNKLLCEYAVRPIGIDTKKPRFSWQIPRGISQDAYRILVSTSPQRLDSDIGDMWDSKRVESSNSINIEYDGLVLESRKGYWWKVKVWIGGVESSWSQPSYFEMGLLNKEDWQAEWIGVPLFDNKRVYIMRRSFNVDKKVKRARVYVSGLGYNEVYINGEKIGDHVLDPGNTDYSKRVLYTTYEADNSLSLGENVIAVLVANGWYKKPSLLLQLYMEFDDGSTQIICTKPLEWHILFSPFLRADIYTGETYDARREIEGWNKPGSIFNKLSKRCPWLIVNTFVDREDNDFIRKFPAMLLPDPGGKLEAQKCEPIKAVEEIKPQRLYSPKEGLYLVEFPQNFSGWIRIKLCGERGKRIVIKYSELVFEDGTINQDNLGTAERTHNMQTDIYILKGDGEEVYEPRFTYHGFRYVQIEGLDEEPDIENIIGVVVHTDLTSTGYFECDNELINRIQECVRWSERTNNHSIMTDCPQRDERHGWLNDLTARAEEAVYNFNMARIFEKVTQDIRDTQDDYTGSIADTAPFKRGQNPADPVCASYLLLPWLSYIFYGNKRLLEESYEGLKKWTNYLYSMTDNGIVVYSYWGDWASPIKECIDNTPVSRNTPGVLMSTGFLYYCLSLLVKIAKVLDKKEDLELLKKRTREIREAFNRKFFNKEKGYYANNSQGANSFALYLKLVPEEYIPSVIDHLVYDVEVKNKGHLTTGNICTKYLLEVLSEYGKVDTAYKIATQTTYPSWGYMLSKGATTIWERWEYATGAAMNSHNHAMYGSVSAWFYKYLAGIRPDENNPAFGEVIIKPHIPSELNSVTASLDTMKGRICVEWQKTASHFELNVQIPANSRAYVYVPINIYPEKREDATLIVNGETVWEKDVFRPVSELEFMEKTKDYIGFIVMPGQYKFQVI